MLHVSSWLMSDADKMTLGNYVDPNDGSYQVAAAAGAKSTAAVGVKSTEAKSTGTSGSQLAAAIKKIKELEAMLASAATGAIASAVDFTSATTVKRSTNYTLPALSSPKVALAAAVRKQKRRGSLR